MKVYAFDVDRTLWLSAGPVTLASIWELREAGHILGLCGNWARVTLSYAPWGMLFSFIGPLGLSKAEFLQQLSVYTKADEFVMVGNDKQEGISPNDALAAHEACWRFIREDDFAAGAR